MCLWSSIVHWEDMCWMGLKIEGPKVSVVLPEGVVWSEAKTQVGSTFRSTVKDLFRGGFHIQPGKTTTTTITVARRDGDIYKLKWERLNKLTTTLFGRYIDSLLKVRGFTSPTKTRVKIFINKIFTTLYNFDSKLKFSDFVQTHFLD